MLTSFKICCGAVNSNTFFLPCGHSICKRCSILFKDRMGREFISHCPFNDCGRYPPDDLGLCKFMAVLKYSAEFLDQNDIENPQFFDREMKIIDHSLQEDASDELQDISKNITDNLEEITKIETNPPPRKTANKRKQSSNYSHASSWDQYFAALFLYREKEQANDFNVPLNYVLQDTDADGRKVILQLGLWLAEQKEIYLGLNKNKKEKLSWARKSMLHQMVEEGQLWCD